MTDTDDVIRLMIEIETGKPPARPDTPELATLRAELAKESAEIKAKGGTVLVPMEIPG